MDLIRDLPDEGFESKRSWPI